jgi:hypothetical protein
VGEADALDDRHRCRSARRVPRRCRCIVSSNTFPSLPPVDPRRSNSK